MTYKKKDSNQRDIETGLRDIGGLWINTTGDPNIGFDGIACFRGRAWFVEVKDGNKPPSQRKLTDGELRRKAQVEHVGCQYNIVHSFDELLQLIGATS